jgi:hypothetical protein
MAERAETPLSTSELGLIASQAVVASGGTKEMAAEVICAFMTFTM